MQKPLSELDKINSFLSSAVAKLHTLAKFSTHIATRTHDTVIQINFNDIKFTTD